jgi:hypothetical protein
MQKNAVAITTAPRMIRVASECALQRKQRQPAVQASRQCTHQTFVKLQFLLMSLISTLNQPRDLQMLVQLSHWQAVTLYTFCRKTNMALGCNVLASWLRRRQAQAKNPKGHQHKPRCKLYQNDCH